MTLRLKPLQNIPLPAIKKDEVFQETLLGKKFTFNGLKQLLGNADYNKAGDRNAKLAAPDEVTCEAARYILSNLTLRYLYDHPLTTNDGRIDSVMCVNYDINLDVFNKIADLTLGEFKNKLLEESGEWIEKHGLALTGTMAAAVAKIMDVHELIYITQKINRPSRARGRLGLAGTLSARCQPNHPIDDLNGITLLTYLGLSMASGDALIGVNPSIDTVDNISQILYQLDKIRKHMGAPTQNCVLSHIKTQILCLKQGVPVEIMFQSLAGTESTNVTEFDVTIETLDEGYLLMQEKGPLKGVAEQWMYFETGQGSEFTYSKHEGIDMTTTEALTYGLARRYDPYMVNNVTGFIGPETHLDSFEMIVANLQDQFMGKLLGLPMGMAPCYTLHSKISLDGQQMATQLLTSAGANYYMDVYLNNDRMLAYFDTSAHDNQTLREIHGKTPTPEFTDWALENDILKISAYGRVVRGKNWGNASYFCPSKSDFQNLVKATPALYGFENAGPRPENKVSRLVRLNQAIARSAVYSEIDCESLAETFGGRIFKTQAENKISHLNSPTLGAQLDPQVKSTLAAENQDIQIVISDGLSAEAVRANVYDLVPVIEDGIKAIGYSLGQIIIVKYGRVKLVEELAETLKTKLILLLIGERPGGDAMAAQSLSCYFAYSLFDPEVQKLAAAFSGNEKIRFEYTVLSNIYSGGINPIEAGSVIVEKSNSILKHCAAGNRLEKGS